ncbi:MAG: transpeptidase [Pelagibacterales bacterium]|nr:transpeptidase [Pelagibacterales bacterium]
MIILKRNYFLIYHKYKYRCAIGKNGIKRLKKEGDYCTPTGQFSLGPIYYRKDRINKLNTKLNVYPITENMIWEDNPNNKNYNKLNLNNKKSREKLFRKDNIYDIIVVVNYNNKPVVPGKGSAIFIHIARNNYFPTKGCIALNKKDLVFLISQLSIDEKILISF